MSREENPNFDEESWIHIYAQFMWHGEATIRGSLGGLVALRDALNVAIERGAAEAKASTGDGEGYGIEIQRVNLHSSLGSVPYLQDLVWKMAAQEMKEDAEWRRKPRARKAPK